MKERYIITAGSRTAHCCFTHTVLDTQSTEDDNSRRGLYDGILLECFSEEDAKLICDALNKYDELKDTLHEK